jgi:hypothetical protein
MKNEYCECGCLAFIECKGRLWCRECAFRGPRSRRSQESANATRIDLAKMAYESRASSDREASKAHAEREYWADGIDPDDV